MPTTNGSVGATPLHAPALPCNMVGALWPFFGTSSESFDDWLGLFDLCMENNSDIIKVNPGLPLTLLRSYMQGVAGKALVALAKKNDERLSDYPALRKYLAARFRPFRTDARRLEALERRKLGANETIQDYSQEIRDLGTKAYGDLVEESILTYRFAVGLPPDMSGAVKMTHCRSLDDAVEVATTYEETYGRHGAPGRAEKARVAAVDEMAPISAHGGGSAAMNTIDKMSAQVEELLSRQQRMDTRLEAVERTMASRGSPRPGDKRDSHGQGITCSYCGRPNHSIDTCRTRGMDAWMAANKELVSQMTPGGGKRDKDPNSHSAQRP